MRTRASKGSELTHGELDANFDRDLDVKTATYAALVSDNRTNLECSHATVAFTVTLGDAATMAAAETGDYEVTISNIGAALVTVARAGSDTIDGAATSIVLAQYSSVTLKVNGATDGYNSIARGGVEIAFVTGVTSAIQTQIDTKAPVADPTFTGEIGIGSVNVAEAELGILDGATLTTAEANELDASAAAVSNYVSGVRTYLHDDSGNTTVFDIDANIGAAWESVGPTGSSATNIWTAMDSIPSAAVGVRLKINNYISGATTSDYYTSTVYGRVTGSSTTPFALTELSKSAVDNTTGSTQATESVSEVMVPLDGSLRFDLYRAVNGTTPTATISAYVIGWVV